MEQRFPRGEKGEPTTKKMTKKVDKKKKKITPKIKKSPEPAAGRRKRSGAGEERSGANKTNPNQTPFPRAGGRKKKISSPPQNFLWQAAALAPSPRPIRARRGRAAPPADTPTERRARGRPDTETLVLCPTKCAPTHTYPQLRLSSRLSATTFSTPRKKKTTKK